MKRGDKVYVNWPTGKGGPYNIILLDGLDVLVDIYGLSIRVPIRWCENIVITEGRLCWEWDDDEEIEPKTRRGAYRYCKGDSYCFDHIEPVHKRWDELAVEEQSRLKWAVGMDPTTKSIFRVAYQLITGEEHP